MLKLNEIMDSLPASEQKIAVYLVSNLNDVVGISVEELAGRSDSSQAAVVRFCKKLGCEGYSEFRLRYKEYLKNQQILLNDTVETTFKGFVSRMDSRDFQESIDNAFRLLKDSQHIIFIGIGSSGILGKYGARYFSNIGRFSLYVEDPFFPILQDMTDHTVTIVLSESGTTYQMLKLANQLKQKGSRLLSITNKADSPLAKLADCNIFYYVPQLMANGTNITTQIPVVYILETLARKLYTYTNG